jgi:4-diphosphocytidyl-2-C-methyl-D-erythritol kinase
MMRLLAHAKVTLSLRVLGTRPDGFHDLEALSVSVTTPFDELELEPADATTIRVVGPYAAGVPTGASNLVVHALARVGRTASVTLRKGIPPGGGLGGGSADAAAVLAALGGTTEDAAALGSDVPFCLQRRPAWMRGRGDVLEPITGLAAVDLVIVAPPFGCSTPAVYGAWDELGGPVATRAVDAPAGYPGPLVNDLEAAAERVEPALGPFRARVEAVLERPALLCGSGASYTAWFGDADAAAGAAARARSELGPDRVWHARTIVD